MYTVVVADDEEELRRAIIRRINWEEIGFQVVGEAENGIEALELVGEKPHYFEAHAVMNANLSKGLAIVAEKYDLPYLPTSFEPTGTPFCGHTLITCMDSMKPGYDPFASLQKAVLAEYAEGQCPMFVCHPGYIDDYLLHHSSLVDPRPMEVAMATDPATKQWLKEHDVTVVTYDEL